MAERLQLQSVKIVRVQTYDAKGHEPGPVIWSACASYSGKTLSEKREEVGESYHAAILLAAAFPPEIESEFKP